MTVSPAQPKTQRLAKPVLTPQEIYYPTRIVRFMGEVFRVVWCDGVNVKLSAGQSGGIYQPYPAGTCWAFDEWVVPVNHIFLSVM